MVQEAACKTQEGVHKGGCNAVTFAHSGLHAATCGQDGIVRLWTAHDGMLATEFKAGIGTVAAGTNCVAFAEERNAVLGASNDKSVKVWDMHTGRLSCTMTGAPRQEAAQAVHCCVSHTGTQRRRRDVQGTTRV